jgi:hypothetical protein
MRAYLITRQNNLRNTVFCANVRHVQVQRFMLAGLRVYVHRTMDYVSEL